MSIYEWIIVIALVGLFITARKWKQAAIYFTIFVLMYGLDHFIMNEATGKMLSFLSMLSIGGRLMLPCFMVGSYIISTTSVHAAIQGLRKWHFPEKLLLTIAVMMRFLPTIRQSYQTIHQSLQMRGVFVSGKDIVLKPVRFFEYMLVPLLMCATRTAQDLTVAVLTKSVTSSVKKTSYKAYAMSWQDGLVLAVITLLCIAINGGIR